MKRPITSIIIATIFIVMGHSQSLMAQTTTVSDIVDSALASNNLIEASRLQVLQDQTAVQQAQIKRLPVVALGSSYVYRFTLGSLTLPLGDMTTAAGLPLANASLLNINQPLGKHQTVGAGALLYQPLTQLPKINTAVNIAKADNRLSDISHQLAAAKLSCTTRQLVYALMAVRYRAKALQLSLDLASRQANDAQAALSAGKTTQSQVLGAITANQNARRILQENSNKESSLIDQIYQLSGINLHGVDIEETPADTVMPFIPEGDHISLQHMQANETAHKAQLAVKAMQQSLLPDVGITAGYGYQNSLDVVDRHNPFVGVSLSWNLQNLLTTSKQIKQQKLALQQAIENQQYVQKTFNTDLANARRKISDANTAMQVTQQAAHYKESLLKTEQNKMAAGMTTATKLLEKQAEYTTAQADYFDARQALLSAYADLIMLLK
ncbi:MAG: TolC family protein [Muribaculaceae bacterium]